MQEEIYKDVVGFEKEYKISDNGKVVSKSRSFKS